eukprot:11198375-Lingulodinium_polyedra.AAC.1
MEGAHAYGAHAYRGRHGRPRDREWSAPPLVPLALALAFALGLAFPKGISRLASLGGVCRAPRVRPQKGHQRDHHDGVNAAGVGERAGHLVEARGHLAPRCSLVVSTSAGQPLLHLAFL